MIITTEEKKKITIEKMKDSGIGGMIINKDFRQKVKEHYLSNKIIIGYYSDLKNESVINTDKKKLYVQNKIDRMNSCNATWKSNFYSKMNIKDFKGTYYCKDKFCLNCKKWRQASRMKKFIPELKKYDNDLYFITFTVPNVRGDKVKETIDKILKGHSKLIKYMENKKKSKIFDTEIFHFIGGIRVLEISINRERKDKYHIHLHCAYILKDYKPSKAYIINKFSIDHKNKRDVRLWTKEEADIQKFWFYMYNDINLKTDVKSLDTYLKLNETTNRYKMTDNEGYSVQIDKFSNNEYSEMFKYMIKDSASYIDKDGIKKFDILNYDEFKTLYFTTANIRQIEAYGILKGIEDNEDDIFTKEEINNLYDEIIKILNREEYYKTIYENIEDITENDSLYISKNKIYTYLRKAYNEEDEKKKPIMANRLKLKDYIYYKEIINNIIKEHNKKYNNNNNKITTIEL